MLHETPSFSPGPHWPPAAAAAARAAVALSGLEPAGLRLVDRWYRHLAESHVAVPHAVDFTGFRGIGTLELLRDALAPIAPQDLPPLRLALRSLRAAKWRAARAAAGSRSARPTGPVPELSVPLASCRRPGNGR